jgi:hypothetical protein
MEKRNSTYQTRSIAVPNGNSDNNSSVVLKQFVDKIKAPYMLNENAIKVLHLCALVGPYPSSETDGNESDINNNSIDNVETETGTSQAISSWQKIYKSLYDESAPPRLVKTMNSFVSDKENIDVGESVWKGVLGYLDTCNKLKDMSIAEICSEDSTIKVFVESTLFKSRGQKDLIESTWNAADIAKSYLTAYTSNYQDIYKISLSNVKLETVNNVKQYRTKNPYINVETLKHIVSYFN